MKKCPYCAESIQEEAVKCRFCGEFLTKSAQTRWYYKTSSLVIAFLCVGPLMLPLVLFNPKLSNYKKLIISVIVIVITIIIAISLTSSIKAIISYYKEMFSFMQ